MMIMMSVMNADVLPAGVFNGCRWSDSGRNQGLSGWAWNGFGQQASWTVPTCMSTYYRYFNLVLSSTCLFQCTLLLIGTLVHS